MKKEEVFLAIIGQLEGDLATLFEAARTAHAAATHEESMPENKYDTLALEASYLAQAQANRAQEIKAALARFRHLSLRHFDEDAEIRLTALVTLQGEGGMRNVVFMGPQGGGLKVRVADTDVTVITPSSPIGRALLGKTVGDVVAIRHDAREIAFEIVALS